jgi:DNA (cytosine-5)-methyltransferase 1
MLQRKKMDLQVMRKGRKIIPVIDLFAGPGGLGEGFSTIIDLDDRAFDIKLSIEMDENAHQTLELRSFTRQFPIGQIPNEYYQLLQEPSLLRRNELRKVLFESYHKEAEISKNEAWKATLGVIPSEIVDERIRKQLGVERNWVLIGGPPCQAYSLVGRARRQEVNELNNQDHRVYLYKEYLRIISVHQPAVFVMENVKGLLSAKLGEEKIFDWIKRDLNNPNIVFPNSASAQYRIFSLVTQAEEFDHEGNPVYYKDTDFLIEAEKYGVPQKRHRVILLGIREDLNVIPKTLTEIKQLISLKDVIHDLPKIRSGISKRVVGQEIIDGKTKRIYQNIIDTDETWSNYISEFRNEIVSWNGFREKVTKLKRAKLTTGGEYIPCNTPFDSNPLNHWYRDEQLKGVCHHESRAHLLEDLLRYEFSSIFAAKYKRFPRLEEYGKHSDKLIPDHKNVDSGKFNDRFRTQLAHKPATTVTSHISKDGHYFIHYDPDQCRSWTVREAARVQTFPDNYLFCGPRTAQFHQVGNAVPPYLAKQIAEVVNDIFQRIENE